MSLGSHASVSSRRSGGSHQKKDIHPLSAEIQVVALRLHANWCLVRLIIHLLRQEVPILIHELLLVRHRTRLFKEVAFLLL